MLVAHITSRAATDVAQFLEQHLTDNATKAHVSNAAEWQEVADALRALTNDSDAIALSDVEGPLAPQPLDGDTTRDNDFVQWQASGSDLSFSQYRADVIGRGAKIFLANPTMRNRRMKEKLEKGQAVDVSAFPRDAEGRYVLDSFAENVDYCDAKTEQWIWSIGRRLTDGVILASTSGDLYQNPAFECLWLR